VYAQEPAFLSVRAWVMHGKLQRSSSSSSSSSTYLAGTLLRKLMLAWRNAWGSKPTSVLLDLRISWVSSLSICLFDTLRALEPCPGKVHGVHHRRSADKSCWTPGDVLHWILCATLSIVCYIVCYIEYCVLHCELHWVLCATLCATLLSATLCATLSIVNKGQRVLILKEENLILLINTCTFLTEAPKTLQLSRSSCWSEENMCCLRAIVCSTKRASMEHVLPVQRFRFQHRPGYTLIAPGSLPQASIWPS